MRPTVFRLRPTTADLDVALPPLSDPVLEYGSLHEDVPRLLRLADQSNESVIALGGSMGARPKVFVSYRRDDVPATARRLARSLAELLGESAVLIDTHAISAGENWQDALQCAGRGARRPGGHRPEVGRSG